MKITRRQLRQLIIEAMFDPRAAREKAKSKVPEDMIKNLNALMSSDDEMNQVMGHDLLDTLGDYESPTGTGSSYQDIKDFDQEMTNKALENRRNQMYAMIPGLEEFEQANKPLHDKFVNILLHPAGIELWLSLQRHHLTSADAKNKIYNLFRDFNNTEDPELQDYLFTEPDRTQIWKGNIYIHALMSTINDDKSLWLSVEEWNEISETLSKLSGVRQLIVEFEILHFIHTFVKHKIEEIT